VLRGSRFRSRHVLITNDRFDTSISTITGRLPQFPLIPRLEPSEVFPETDQRTWNIGGVEHGDSLGLVRVVSEPLFSVLRKIVQLTQVVDYSSSRPWTRAERIRLSFGRSITQHGLMAQLTSQFDIKSFAAERVDNIDLQSWGPVTDSLALMEAIRIAAAIYSVMVIFPHPWTLGITRRLAKRLYHVWETGELCHLCQNNRDYHCLFVWLLWFGCFGSFRSRQQDWFERELRRVLDVAYGPSLRSMTFESVRESLRGFLWWDTVCDKPGRELWARVVSRVIIE
jgi:hypothetical protein